MDKQITLSAFSDELANVRTKKKEFLAQIDRIVPWGKWVEEIRPCYYKGERGNKPYDLELMLRIYCAATRFNQNRRHNTIREISFGEYKRFPGAELRETVIVKTPVH